LWSKTLSYEKEKIGLHIQSPKPKKYVAAVTCSYLSKSHFDNRLAKGSIGFMAFRHWRGDRQDAYSKGLLQKAVNISLLSTVLKAEKKNSKGV
jgi:hypothetical protein